MNYTGFYPAIKLAFTGRNYRSSEYFYFAIRSIESKQSLGSSHSGHLKDINLLYHTSYPTS